MFYLIYLLVVGISFAPFIFPKIDIWHAQGIWVQSMTLVIFSYSLFERPKYVGPTNKSLFLLNLWVGGFTAFICFVAQHKQSYDVKHFFPYFNFLCLMVLYKMIVHYLNRNQIRKILDGMKYVVIVTLVMSGLQYIGMAQFFEFLRNNEWYHDSPVVGFIGNGTHLSGFLATTIPLFLIVSRENALALITMFLILCVSGTSLRDPALSGFLVAIAILIFTFVKNKRSLWIVFWTLAALVTVILILAPGDLLLRFFSFNGRIELWKFYSSFFASFKTMALTGFGPGAINIIYKDTPFDNIRHMHMEYFHFAFEVGLIGLVLILNAIKEFFAVKTESNINKAMFLGFLVSACFNYPAHLWLPATWAVFNYAAVYAERNHALNKETN